MRFLGFPNFLYFFHLCNLVTPPNATKTIQQSMTSDVKISLAQIQLLILNLILDDHAPDFRSPLVNSVPVT